MFSSSLDRRVLKEIEPAKAHARIPISVENAHFMNSVRRFQSGSPTPSAKMPAGLLVELIRPVVKRTSPAAEFVPLIFEPIPQSVHSIAPAFHFIPRAVHLIPRLVQMAAGVVQDIPPVVTTVPPDVIAAPPDVIAAAPDVITAPLTHVPVPKTYFTNYLHTSAVRSRDWPRPLSTASFASLRVLLTGRSVRESAFTTRHHSREKRGDQAFSCGFCPPRAAAPPTISTFGLTERKFQ